MSEIKTNPVKPKYRKAIVESYGKDHTDGKLRIRPSDFDRPFYLSYEGSSHDTAFGATGCRVLDEMGLEIVGIINKPGGMTIHVKEQ